MSENVAMKNILPLFLSWIYPYLFTVFSLLIVAFSQPDWGVFPCVLASAIGYALFWKGMLYFPLKKERFFLACIWFAGVESVHLNWFMSDKYVGGYIFLFLSIFLAFMGVCFGLLCLAIQSPKDMRFWRMVGIAGGWTLFEWGRLFILSGFSWDPIGLSLTSTLEGMQLLSGFGIFGLTFWVLLTNLFALKWLSYPFRLGPCFLWSLTAAAPYLYGWSVVDFHEKRMKEISFPEASILLVQTSLYPEEKIAFNPEHSSALSPLAQWKRILTLLKKHRDKPIDLIVLPEAAVPYGTDIPLFTLDQVAQAFEEIFSAHLIHEEQGDTRVGNAYWAHALANYFQSDLLIGLEEAERVPMQSAIKAFNAAFFFKPNSGVRERYEKRVLVPMGEYIPFQWCKKILSHYGIEDSFTPGKEAKVFEGKKVPIGTSICYEETYGHLMRENRLKGAGLLVNLSNDAWYPRSRLPVVHYLHGRIRSVEEGIPLVRACNTGITCAVDSLGRTVGFLDYEDERGLSSSGVLHVNLSTYKYPTLYSRYGDLLIIWVSILSLIVAVSAAWCPKPTPFFDKI